ncbi:hypothetical protein AO382_0429 [Moraxella catarrhalis]|uniref:Uncharacterized protein n=1 Tax=Moraxella catarrhalis TaxID=480 RepID=A0A7Z0V089_MORCA|nr:hypothetical protein AO382_0429 [Moraxella catarrhalis]
MKGVAREILKDEAPPAQTAQQPQVQDLQPVIPNGQQPVQQYNQYGQPITNQQQMPMQPNQMPQTQDPNAMAQAAPLPPKPAPAPQVSERVVRKRAYVLTSMAVMSWFVAHQIATRAKLATCMTAKTFGSLVKQPTAKPSMVYMAAG